MGCLPNIFARVVEEIKHNSGNTRAPITDSEVMDALSIAGEKYLSYLGGEPVPTAILHLLTQKFAAFTTTRIDIFSSESVINAPPTPAPWKSSPE